jgi:hypothetical protein
MRGFVIVLQTGSFSMRRFVSLSAGITALVILVGAVTTANAKERPFFLSGTGQLVMGQGGAGTFTASGTASYLGKWTNSGTIEFVPGPEPDTLAASGEVTFTAADGDTLEATFEGVLDLTTGIGLAVFIFDGGTGRFANASGTADAVIQQNPDGSFKFRMQGGLDF